jgi:hypothetical protein
MYILKIKGVDKMPDFIQIRDQDFTLVAYFRADNPAKGAGIIKIMSAVELGAVIQELPYGKIREL